MRARGSSDDEHRCAASFEIIIVLQLIDEKGSEKTICTVGSTAERTVPATEREMI